MPQSEEFHAADTDTGAARSLCISNSTDRASRPCSLQGGSPSGGGQQSIVKEGMEEKEVPCSQWLAPTRPWSLVQAAHCDHSQFTWPWLVALMMSSPDDDLGAFSPMAPDPLQQPTCPSAQVLPSAQHSHELLEAGSFPSYVPVSHGNL